MVISPYAWDINSQGANKHKTPLASHIGQKERNLSSSLNMSTKLIAAQYSREESHHLQTDCVIYTSLGRYTMASNIAEIKLLDSILRFFFRCCADGHSTPNISRSHNLGFFSRHRDRQLCDDHINMVNGS